MPTYWSLHKTLSSMWFRGLLVNTSFLEVYIPTPQGETVLYIGPSGPLLSTSLSGVCYIISFVFVCMCVYVLNHFSHVQIFVTVWTVAWQAHLFMGFSRKEHWSGLPYPPLGESSPPRDWTHVSYVSCIGSWVLYHEHHLESPSYPLVHHKLVSISKYFPKFCDPY